MNKSNNEFLFNSIKYERNNKRKSKKIINKIGEYIKVFTQASSGYLEDIIKVENTKKKIFMKL